MSLKYSAIHYEVYSSSNLRLKVSKNRVGCNLQRTLSSCAEQLQLQDVSQGLIQESSEHVQCLGILHTSGTVTQCLPTPMVNFFPTPDQNFPYFNVCLLLPSQSLRASEKTWLSLRGHPDSSCGSSELFPLPSRLQTEQTMVSQTQCTSQASAPEQPPWPSAGPAKEHQCLSSTGQPQMA